MILIDKSTTTTTTTHNNKQASRLRVVVAGGGKQTNKQNIEVSMISRQPNSHSSSSIMILIKAF
jgi:hypothetical protein